MPSQAMLNLFNSQIDMELFSSNQYRQMGAWCESKGSSVALASSSNRRRRNSTTCAR